jgi:hypothetical protein
MMPSRARKSSAKEEGKSPQWDDVDQVVFDLTKKLGELTGNFVSQTEKFFESLRQLKLKERLTPNLQQVGELIAKHDQIAKDFGDKVGKLREEDLLFSDEVSAIAEDLHGRIGKYRLALDKVDVWEQELEGLIGGRGSQGTSFDSLLTQYMGQIQVLGDIATKFAIKVQACEACMDVATYETLIKSYEDILETWGRLLKSVEDLLNSKRDLFYNLAKAREDLLESYENLTKSVIEVEDKRLDLLNKPLRKEEEFAKSNQDIVKSSVEILTSLEQVLLVVPAQIEEEFLKSTAEVLTALEDIIKSIKGIPTPPSGSGG